MRKKILLSAYACFDGYGSEPGVGYNWLTKIVHNTNYKVVLCTSGWSYERLKADPILKKIEVIKIGSCKGDQMFRSNRLLFQVYILIWQLTLLVKLLVRNESFDIAHHLTFGGVTIPSFVFLFSKNSIYGPVGGGERAPIYLAKAAGNKSYVKELLKILSVWLIKLDPFLFLTRKGFKKILIKNNDNRHLYIKESSKLSIKPEICYVGELAEYKKECDNLKKSYCIFAARGVYWKGGNISIDVIREYNKKSSNKLTLEFFGEGGAFNEWELKASAVEGANFHGRVSRDRLWTFLKFADFLIFPSFHDSSGNAVLEALCMGTPVLAFDLGGPSSIIEHEYMLINPDQNYQKILDDFIVKIKYIKSLTKKERIEIANFYRQKFSPNKLLEGVY